MSRAARLLRLLDELRGRRRPTPASVLADRLGVSIRTVYRDLATLQAGGTALRAVGGQGYLLDPEGSLVPPALTRAEAEAILLGLSYVEQRGDACLAAAAGAARRKLIDSSASVGSQSRVQALRVGPGPVARLRAPLLEAIRAERRVDVGYRDKAGLQTWRRLWPLSIGLFDDCEVLAAWCELRAGFRSFRLDRIDDLAVTDARLPRPRRVLLAEWERAAGLEGD